MERAILSFAKGMNTDLSKAIRSPESYLLAKNFTFSSYDGQTNGELENAKGNVEINALNFGEDQEIVGYTTILNEVVIFTTDGTTSIIWLWDEDSLTLTEIINDDNTPDGSRFNFSLNRENRVVAVGRKENDSNIKVYWTDGLNNLRYIDLSIDNSGLPIKAFDVVQDYPAASISASEAEGGSLKAGAYYFTFKLYALNGASTAFYPLSERVLITKTSRNAELKSFTGADKDTDCNKSINVTVNLEPFVGITWDNYNLTNAKLYSIFYPDYNGNPIITCFADIKIPSSKVIKCVETGNTVIEEISLEEFNSELRVFSADTLEVKNNILFAGGISDDSFDVDFDARTYRWKADSIYSSVRESDNGYYLIESNGDWSRRNDIGTEIDSGTNWELPEEADLMNLYNNMEYDLDTAPYSTYPYMYKADQITLGGEGPNVSYTFYYQQEKISNDGYAGTPTEGTILDNQSRITLNTVDNNVGYKRGEVYRFGVVFISNKGQRSFVKWIGDIRFPDNLTGDDFRKYNTVNIEGCSLMGISFEMDFTGLDITNIHSVEIVRAYRSEKDKNIVAQGVIQPNIISSDINYPVASIANYSLVDTPTAALKYVNFYSPESIYNEAIKDYNNLECKVIGAQHFKSDSNNFSFLYSCGEFSTTGVFVTTSTDLNITVPQVKLITQSTKVGVSDDKGYRYAISANDRDIVYLNRTYVGDDYAGTNYVFELETAFEQMATSTEDFNYLVEIVRPAYNVQYNGPSYYQRLTTEYISVRNYPINKSTLFGNNPYAFSKTMFGGDTYIVPFEFVTAMKDKDAGPAGADQAKTVILETSYNLHYIHNESASKYLTKDNPVDTPTQAIQEKVTKGIEIWGAAYPTELGDLYIYNNVYSNEKVFPKFYPKPINFENIPDNKVMIVSSEKKFNGEPIDSWTIFKYVNFIEVDTKYGDITNLKTVDNKLFFWQEKSFGVLAVNDRYIIGEGPGQLALGTGGVLERYDYISTTVGCSDKYSITKTDNALFWTDSISRGFYTYGQGLQNLSISAGIQSYRYDTSTLTPTVAYDGLNNQILFGNANEVLVYNLLLGAFTGVYTYVPRLYLELRDGNILSTNDGNSVWRHNVTDVPRGSYYGIVYPSYIKLLCNHNYTSTKVFDTLSWESTSVSEEGINIFEDTFYRYRVTNDYQNTDWQTISTKRKERGFTTTVPRDRVNGPESSNLDIFDPSNLDANQTYKRRVRDKYMILEMEYDNSTGNKFSFPFIVINYRQSYR